MFLDFAIWPKYQIFDYTKDEEYVILVKLIYLLVYILVCLQKDRGNLILGMRMGLLR